ncbi:MAG TPA: DUF3426 domain-containing protein [Caulobacteraceae bacterium]
MRAEIGDLEVGFAQASDSNRMILTCPECATGYFVPDGQIGPGGRTVRCAACGHRWTAKPDAPLELSVSPEEGAIAKPAETEPEPALTAEDLPRAFRSRAEEDKKLRQAAVTGAAWAGAAVVIALLIGAAILFRQQVVGIWPQTASAYAAIGLPVNAVGLVIENIHAEPSLQDGRATLNVSGVIRNITSHEVMAPPLRITLNNAQGKRVAGLIDTLSNGRIPPGATRHFLAAVFDPPFSASDLQVDFAVGAHSQGVATTSAASNAVAAPGSTSLRGPDQTPVFGADSNAAAAPVVTEEGAANTASSNAAAAK